MRFRVVALVVPFLCSGFFLSAGPLVAAPTSPSPLIVRGLAPSEARGGPAPLYVPTHILVKFRKGASATVQQQTIQAAGGERLRTTRTGYDVIRVPEGKDVTQLVNAYASRPDVERAQPDALVSATFTPNDPQFAIQWNFDASHANLPAAWDQDTTSPQRGGDPSVIVAVIDTGVAYENYQSFTKAPDFEGTSFVPGYDFVSGDTHANDDHYHGTHVAMTIAESTNNGLAMAGMAYKTTIMPIKALNALGSGTASDVADGILFAIDNGADVINMSLGSYVDDPLLESAVQEAIDAGVVLVAAVGNGDAPESFGGDGVYGTGDPVVLYPASYPGVIGVGAIRYDRASAPYSNSGPGTDLVAPGGVITVDQNGDGYGDGILQQTLGDELDEFASVFLAGTSMASPHVAAAAALLLADGVAPEDIASRLKSTAQKNLPNYSSTRHGSGMLDAAAMFNATDDLTPPPPVKNLVAKAADQQVTLTWSNPSSSDFAQIRVYRKKGSAPTSYGTGSLIFSGTGKTVIDTQLTNGSTYYYAVYALDTSGNYSSVARISAFPATEETTPTPPALPQGFRVKSHTASSVVLAWKLPSDEDLAGVVIRRSTVDFPADAASGTERSRGTGTSLTDSNLLAGTTYFYAAFAYDTHGVFSEPAFAVVTPGSTDTEDPAAVTALTSAVFPTLVRLQWADPTNLDYAFTAVVRKTGTTAPTSLTDGRTVYTGTDGRVTDEAQLIPGTTYTYSLFAIDFSGNVSKRTTLSARVPGALILTAPASSGGPQVRLFNPDGTWNGTQFFAYDPEFRGGAHLAAADVDGDGVDEIVVGAGKGGGPHIRVFEKDGTAKPIQFFAFLPSFRGGIDVAAGDTDGDGKAEIAACQFSGGQAWVKVYKYDAAKTVVGTWNAFGAPEVGCTVAMGDVDKDGKDEVIVGAGKGGGPHVRVFEADGTPKPIQFFAFLPSFRGGVDVASGDVDADGRDEVIVSQLSEGQAWVKTYGFTADRPVLGTFNAFGTPEVGASVDTADLDGDGKAEILAGAGAGGGPQVRAFSPVGTPFGGTSFFAYDTAFRGGVSLGAGVF